MKRKISFMVVDDHGLVREGMKQMAAAHADLEMVGEAGSGQEILSKIKRNNPDVVLLDIVLPDLNGLALIPLLREAAPRTRLVMLSMHNKEPYVHQALSAGAVGYVLKGDATSEVAEAIRKAAAGQYFLSSALNSEVIRGYLKPKSSDSAESLDLTGYNSLTNREQQIFRLVVEGHRSKDIAAMLYLSPRTVEKHRSNIAHKLGVKDTAAMVRYAVKIGVVDPDLWSQ